MPTTLAALTLHQRLVLSALTRTNVAYPIDTLASLTNLDVKEVVLALSGLRDKRLARRDDIPLGLPSLFRATKSGTADALAYRNVARRS